MKIITICLLALAGSFFLSSCISVKTQRTTPATRVTSTTTEQTTVNRPRSTTVETQTTRNY